MAAARSLAGTDGDAAHRRTWEVPRAIPAVGRARRELRSMLEQAGVDRDACDRVLLVAHELVVNGVEHGDSAVRLSVELRAGTVRLDVHDGCPDPPRLQPMDPGAARGRGLQMVAGSAPDWGWLAEPDGKTVWAEVPVEGDPGPAA